MKDSGNRAFWSIVATATAGYVLVTASVCCVAALVGRQLYPGGRATDWGLLLPAMTLLALVTLGAGLTLAQVVRESRLLRGLGRTLRETRVPVPDRARRAAIHAALGHRLDVVSGSEPFALTYGLFTPRIAISTALVDQASPTELEAVFAHERSHLRSRDPLKVLVARLLLAQGFYLPILRHLRSLFVAGRELAADRSAVAACGRTPLAGALLTVQDSPPPAGPAPATAFGAPDLLDARVTQLEDGRQPRLPRPPFPTILATALGATVAVWAATGSMLLLLQFCPCMNATG